MLSIDTINFVLAVGGLALLLITVVLYIDYFLFNGRYTGERVKEIAWLGIIGTTVGTVVLSLLYSEYFGFIPCSLCWLQRIAVYPQAVMSLMAWRYQDASLFPLYGIALSVLGFGVAVYQYVYQMLPQETISSGVMPCLIDGSGADCGLKVIEEFGFVTFPFLSAVSFAFLIILYLNLRKD